MKASAFILVLFVLVAACRRHPEPAASSDKGMQRNLAGVWVHVQRFPSGEDIVDTVEMTPGGTYTAVHSFPKRKRGLRTIEESGTWRVEDGVLIKTITSFSLTNALGPNEWRLKIVRLDDVELELDSPELDLSDKIVGLRVPAHRDIYRKQTR